MKKRTMAPAILSALALAAAIGGCGQDSGAGSTAAAAQTAQTEAEAAAEATPQSPAENGNGAAAKLLTTVKTTQYFTSDPVPDADAEQILAAGINTTSGMNQQPWHFSAVSDTSVLQEIADEMSSLMPGGPSSAAADSSAPAETAEAAEKAPSKAQIGDAPLAVIVSCREGSELDAGLACQSMFAEARLLGYGAKIVSSPTLVLNGDNQAHYRELLGIPEDQSAVTVLLVGTEDTSVDSSLDGYTAASARSAAEDIVTYVKAK